MTDPVETIRIETDGIHASADLIEIASTELVSVEDWRDALGFIDGASLRLYTLRQNYLKQARQSAERRRPSAEGTQAPPDTGAGTRQDDQPEGD